MLVAFAAFALLAHTFRVWRLRETLVEESVRQRSKVWARTTHVVSPAVCTFADRVDPLLETLLRENPAGDAWALTQGCQDALLNWRRGGDVAPLPQRCLDEAESLATSVRPLFEATHCEALRVPSRYWERNTGWAGRPSKPKSWWEYVNEALRISALCLVSDVQRGDTRTAVNRWADMLALSRDASIGTDDVAWYRTDYALSLSRKLLAETLAKSTRGERRQIVARMKRIAEELPTHAEALQSGILDAQLGFFGELLSDAQLTRLALTRAEVELPNRAGSEHPVFLFFAWPTYERYLRRRASIAADPAEFRMKADALDDDLAGRWNPALYSSTPRRFSLRTFNGFAKRDLRLGMFIRAFEISLDPTRLWAPDVDGVSVQVVFEDGPWVRLRASDPTAPPHELEVTFELNLAQTGLLPDGESPLVPSLLE